MPENAEAKGEDRARRLIWVNWAFLVVQGLAWLLIPLLLVEREEVFLAAASWSLLLLPYALGALPAGHFGDQHNRFAVLTLAFALSLSASLALLAGVGISEGSSLLILLASFLFGLARPFADAAIIGELSKRGNANSQMKGMSRAVAGEPGGRVLGAGLLWLALLLSDFLGASLVTLLLSFLLLLLLFWARPAFASQQEREEAGDVAKPWRLRFLRIARQPQLASVVLFGVFWNLFMAGIIGGLAPAFIKDLLPSISAPDIALLLLAASIVAVSGSFLSPRISRDLGTEKTLWSMTALATALLLAVSLIGSAGNTVLFVASLLLFYFANQVFVTNLIVGRQLLAPRESLSTVATLTRMITWVALAAGTLFYGAALSLFSATTLLQLMSALAGALLLIYFFLWRKNITGNQKNPSVS